MSAAGRGAVRAPYDLYETPMESIEAVLPHIYIPVNGTILEPTAGSGNVIRALKNHYIPFGINEYHACEIDEVHRASLEELCHEVFIQDFLTFYPEDTYDLVIGNPPYHLAKECIEHALTLLSEGGILVFLLRLNFLESQKRKQFWKEHPVKQLYVLSKRPSFTGHGTDATSYSWFVWGDVPTKIKVI